MASRKEISSSGARDAVPIKQCIKWYLENNIVLSNDDRALLKRLFTDFRTEHVWSTIRAHAERRDGRPFDGDAPIEFIITVLQLKKAAEQESQMNADIAIIVAEKKRLEPKATRRLERKARQVPLEKKAEFWKRALAGYPSAAISPPLVRSDEKGSRVRTYFMRDLSASVHDITGRWLDEQVAVITELAFGGEGVSSDAVRKARSK
jgi:hypothetical protein